MLCDIRGCGQYVEGCGQYVEGVVHADLDIHNAVSHVPFVAGYTASAKEGSG